MEYVVPFILLVISMVLFEILYPNKSASRFFFVSFVIYFSILMALRYRVGGDTLAYMSSYSRIPTLDKLELQDLLYTISDPFYVLLCSISKTIHPSFYVFQIIHSVILNVSLSVFLMRYSKMLLFSFVLFLFSNYLYFSTEILRESLAISVFLFAFRYLIDKKYIKYYLFCLLAFGFHASAVILFLVPLFMGKHLGFKELIKLFLFFVFLFFVRELIVGSISEYLPVYITSKRSVLLEDEDKTIMWIVASLLKQIVIPSLVVFIYFKITDNRLKFESFIVMYMYLGIGSLLFHTVFFRFSNYFVLFFLVSMTNLFKEVVLKKTRVTYIYASFCMLFMFVTICQREYVSGASVMYGYNRYEGWYPYYSIFDERMNSNREIYIYRRDR